MPLAAATEQQKTRRAHSSTAHESSDPVRSRKGQCQALPDNPETEYTYHKWKEKLRWRESRKQGTKTYTSTAAAVAQPPLPAHYPPPLPATTTTTTHTYDIATNVIIGWNSCEYVG